MTVEIILAGIAILVGLNGALQAGTFFRLGSLRTAVDFHAAKLEAQTNEINANTNRIVELEKEVISKCAPCPPRRPQTRKSHKR